MTDVPRHARDLRLSWGECDPAGIVYYATYLQWAERAHSEWWLLEGVHLAELAERLGAAFVVRHVECDYLHPPRVLDELRCSLHVDAVGSSSFTTRFDFTDLDSGRALAELRQTCVFVDGDGRSTPIPDLARKILEP